MIRDIEYDGKSYWMASNNGLVKMEENTISAVFFRDGRFTNVIRDIAIEGNILWIATNFGLIRYEQ
jgi:ligand-binding sensor domain-containing protein